MTRRYPDTLLVTWVVRRFTVGFGADINNELSCMKWDISVR